MLYTQGGVTELTGEAANDEIRAPWEARQRRYVIVKLGVSKARADDGLGTWFDLADELGLMPRTGESSLESTDASEETSDPERTARLGPSRGLHRERQRDLADVRGHRHSTYRLFSERSTGIREGS